MTCNTWHMTPDTWHMTYDTWHVTFGWGWTFSQNFRCLTFGCNAVLNCWRKRISECMNVKGFYRTAPVTPGPLKTWWIYNVLVIQFSNCSALSYCYIMYLLKNIQFKHLFSHSTSTPPTNLNPQSFPQYWRQYYEEVAIWDMTKKTRIYIYMHKLGQDQHMMI